MMDSIEQQIKPPTVIHMVTSLDQYSRHYYNTDNERVWNRKCPDICYCSDADLACICSQRPSRSIIAFGQTLTRSPLTLDFLASILTWHSKCEHKVLTYATNLHSGSGKCTQGALSTRSWGFGSCTTGGSKLNVKSIYANFFAPWNKKSCDLYQN